MPGRGLGGLRGLADPPGAPNAAGLTAGFDMRPGVSRPLWPGRAFYVGGPLRVLSLPLRRAERASLGFHPATSLRGG